MSRRISRRTFLGTTALGSTLLSRCSFNPCPAGPAAPPFDGCVGGHHFKNWAETISCTPSSYCQPRTVDELASVVKKAAAAGKKVRTVGAGHSWSPLVLTNDVLVNLDRMQSLLHVDPATQRATVQAGIRLKNLITALREPHHLGLANLGSVTEQSIAGATTTGTHGTGLPFAILASQIVGMKILSGKGEVVSIDGGDLLRAARVSLGALGIITEVTLQCVADRQIERTMYWCKFDEVVENLDRIVRENERLRLWWVAWALGCRDNVIVTTLNTPGADPGFLGKFPEVARRVDQGLPMDTKKLLGLRAKGKEPECFRFKPERLPYDQALTVPLLRVLHRECEYSIPLARKEEALRGMRRMFEERDWRFLMPIEVRFVKQDDSLLSPAIEGDSCYIGVSAREQEFPLEVFAEFEPLVRSLGGRPHWGKIFNLTASQTRELYRGTYDRFCEIRRDMDPAGVFANEQIRRLFG